MVMVKNSMRKKQELARKMQLIGVARATAAREERRAAASAPASAPAPAFNDNDNNTTTNTTTATAATTATTTVRDKMSAGGASVRFFCSGPTLSVEAWHELASAYGRVADVQCEANGSVVVDFHRSTPEADCRRCVEELNNAIIDGHVLSAESGKASALTFRKSIE
jgi:hypothetical protein